MAQYLTRQKFRGGFYWVCHASKRWASATLFKQNFRALTGKEWLIRFQSVQIKSNPFIWNAAFSRELQAPKYQTNTSDCHTAPCFHISSREKNNANAIKGFRESAVSFRRDTAQVQYNRTRYVLSFTTRAISQLELEKTTSYHIADKILYSVFPIFRSIIFAESFPTITRTPTAIIRIKKSQRFFFPPVNNDKIRRIHGDPSRRAPQYCLDRRFNYPEWQSFANLEIKFGRCERERAPEYRDSAFGA